MKRKLRRSSHRSAFTLLELLLVLVIIAAIAGIAVYNTVGIQDKAYKSTAAGQIESLKNMLETYRLTNSTYPQTLESLHEQPSDVDTNDWIQTSRDPIKPDPWGNAFEYTLNGNAYELQSLGPDGKSGTEDDITDKGK